jgi:hypothetical protein
VGTRPRLHLKTNRWQITFIFILILFIDSCNRVYRVQLESGAAAKNAKYVVSHTTLPHTIMS